MTSDPTTDRHREARERVARYIEARTGMSGLGPDEVHAVWVDDEEEERRLLLSDLNELLASPADSLDEARLARLERIEAAAKRVMEWADHHQPWNPSGDFAALREALDA